MKSYGADQAEFMSVSGVQTVGVWNASQISRYVNHLEEEARETRRAFEIRDAIKLVDGAVDTIVIALGILHSAGVNPDECWAAVHRANMRKVDGSCGEIVLRKDGQIGKPADWFGPEADLEKILNGVSGHADVW